MRIAVIDHSFHERTGSSGFFFELLGAMGEVEVFSDDSWQTGRVDKTLVEKLLEKDFDRVISYQVMWPADLLESLGLKDVVFVPMWDDVRKRTDRWWNGYRGQRFVSFSRALSDRLARISGDVLDVQYYPEPVEPMETSGDGLRAFFWQRSDSLSWQTVWRTAQRTDWEQFHLHWAPDPGSTGEPPSESFCREHSIRLSEWFDHQADLLAIMSDSDVYFAPRLYEGIGMGFLESMARGQCVVAPNLPTHNEYIESGRNGILYDPKNPEELSFDGVKSLGRAARADCERGFSKWLLQREQICEFIQAAPQTPVMPKLTAALEETPASSKRWDIRGPLWQRAGRRLIRGLGKN